jgi:hypothetical protein
MKILRYLPFIHNVRRGLATNSSSSHSLVFFKTPRVDHDAELDVSGLSTEFGWDVFKLTTKREKLMYAFVSILQKEGLNVGWRGGGTDGISDELEDVIKRYPEHTDIVKRASAGYIDHQSADASPERLLEAALDPKVEIWGGNDNGGNPHDDYMMYDGDTYDRIVDPAQAPPDLDRVEWL